MKNWAFILVAALTAYVVARAPWRSQVSSHSDANAIERLSKRVISLEEELSRQRNARQVGAAPPSTSHENLQPNAHSKLAEPEDRDIARLSETELNKLAADELEERFYGEAHDRAFSAKMTAHFKEAIASSDASSRVLEASCATSMCRLVLAHDTKQAQHDIGTLLTSSPMFLNGTFLDYDTSHSPPATVVYVLREGHAFARATPMPKH